MSQPIMPLIQVMEDLARAIETTDSLRSDLVRQLDQLGDPEQFNGLQLRMQDSIKNDIADCQMVIGYFEDTRRELIRGIAASVRTDAWSSHVDDEMKPDENVDKRVHAKTIGKARYEIVEDRDRGTYRVLLVKSPPSIRPRVTEDRGTYPSLALAKTAAEVSAC